MKPRRGIVMEATDAAGEVELSIFGPIGGDWWGGGVTLDAFKDVYDQIKDSAKIRLLLNSEGGDAFEGMAMYNLLSKVRDRLTVEVLGFAASAASVIALAGKELVMDEGAYLMIHEPWGVSVGPSDEHRKTADLLEKMSGNFADLYAAHSNLSRDEALAAMKAETWYTAAEAVDAGFAMAVGEKAEVEAMSIDIARFNYQHVPSGLGTAAASADREVPRTAKAFERFLRESGYSRSEATGIAARGARALLPERESRDPPEPASPASSESERPDEDQELMLRSRSKGADINKHWRVT
jgi:ATP-dependent protease ClpP protease subunit